MHRRHGLGWRTTGSLRCNICLTARHGSQQESHDTHTQSALRMLLVNELILIVFILVGTVSHVLQAAEGDSCASHRNEEEDAKVKGAATRSVCVACRLLQGLEGCLLLLHPESKGKAASVGWRLQRERQGRRSSSQRHGVRGAALERGISRRLTCWQARFQQGMQA